MESLIRYILLLAPIIVTIDAQLDFSYARCHIPATLHGQWYSREDGNNVFTDIDSSTFTNRGHCLEMISNSYDNFTFVFQQG